MSFSAQFMKHEQEKSVETHVGERIATGYNRVTTAEQDVVQNEVSDPCHVYNPSAAQGKQARTLGV